MLPSKSFTLGNFVRFLRHGFSQKRQALLDRILGFDYFISYSHRDGMNYPKHLSVRLKESGFRVFLDSEVYGPGDDLNTSTRRRVRMSTYLVIIARPAAMTTSRWVLEELYECLRANRTPVVIDVNDAFDKARDDLQIKELLQNRLFIDEDQPCAEGHFFDGEPSDLVLEELRRGFTATRQNTLRLRVMTLAVFVLAGLAVASMYLYYRANTERIAALGSMFDTSSVQRFSEASEHDLRQQIEFDRYRKLRNEYYTVKSAVAKKGEDSITRMRLKVLEDELAQYRVYIESLREQATKSRSLGKQDLQQADNQWKVFNARLFGRAARERVRPTPPLIFSVEVLNASNGESLILHYGEVDNPRLILIDGGTKEVFKEHLGPRLAELKEYWNNTARLRLDMIIVSQSDYQRLEGIDALTDTMLEQKGTTPDYSIRTVWFNHFIPIAPEFASYHLAQQPNRKWRLARNLLSLNIPVNLPFNNFVGRPKRGVVRVQGEAGLTITVLNPTVELLAQYQNEQVKEWKRHGAEVSPPAPSEKDFSGTGLTRIEPGGDKCFYPLPSGGLDRSVVNRASLVLMFEYGDSSVQGGLKRFLYTGDANDSQILDGLCQAGYLDAEGKVRVDALLIPHYGSHMNVSEEFFRRVVADHYIITGNGRFKNPEPTTLNMIVSARHNEAYTIHFAHRIGIQNMGTRIDEVGSGELGHELDEFFMNSFSGDSKYRRVFRPPNENSLVINLLEPVRY